MRCTHCVHPHLPSGRQISYGGQDLGRYHLPAGRPLFLYDSGILDIVFTDRMPEGNAAFSACLKKSPELSDLEPLQLLHRFDPAGPHGYRHFT
jgi:hypothetical protein